MVCLFYFLRKTKPDIESARVQFGDDKTYIGLYHAALLNAKTDIGYEIDHGAGLEILMVVILLCWVIFIKTIIQP
jgi:hypothetical protein